MQNEKRTKSSLEAFAWSDLFIWTLAALTVHQHFEMPPFCLNSLEITKTLQFIKLPLRKKFIMWRRINFYFFIILSKLFMTNQDETPRLLSPL